MTQPAKVQEPSMEEILASIRRIIADDEAKPAEAPPAPTPVAPAPKPAVVASGPPPAPKPAPAPAPKVAEKVPEPAASNNQDDIDAMLASLDAVTSEPEVRVAPPPVDDVFELTDEMVVADEPEPAFRRVEPTDDLEFSEATATSVQPPRFEPPSYETPAREQPAMTPQMMSHTTASAVESAFHSLANTVLSNNARTLEDLVKEMLRPMLKSWIDDNLPGLVERIVKAEIERVSRGNGR